MPAYWEHIRSLTLPEEIQKLAEFNLHDGIIIDVMHVEEQTILLLKFRLGDLQVGYYDAVLSFSEVRIADDVLTSIHQVRNANQVELLYDEVDRYDLGLYEFRLIFSNLVEAKFLFKHIVITKRLVADRDSPLSTLSNN